MELNGTLGYQLSSLQALKTMYELILEIITLDYGCPFHNLYLPFLNLQGPKQQLLA